MNGEVSYGRPYKEVQKFTSPLLWLFLTSLFLVTLLFFTFTLVNDFAVDKTIGDNTPAVEYAAMLFFIMLIIAAIYLFAVMRLEITVDKDYLIYSYKPFFTRQIPHDELIGFEERKYRPLLEYGGWGIRYSIFGHGWSYTVSGNKGIQFLTKNGKKFLLGSQRPESIIYYLNKYKKY